MSQESLIPTNAYFDCNATTPTLPVAAQAALSAMHTLYGNPSSVHLAGLQAKFILESVRKTAAKTIHVSPEQIIFTSGATEAIQTAVFSVLQTARRENVKPGAKLLYSAIEHKAVPEALYHWVEALGLPFEIVKIPVDSQGRLELDFLRKELPSAILLCTMAVNNETGVIQDLKAIEKVLHDSQSKARWLVDCVQALGKIDLDSAISESTMPPFSGHKLYAPKGVGFLYTRKDAPFVPLIVGGGQERGMRSGTENLPGVAGFGAVLDRISDPKFFLTHSKLLQFREKLVSTLKRAFPKIEFNTPFDISVPTTINFSVEGFSSRELLDLFDSAGLRVSAGSACGATTAKPSYVLDAMGVPAWRSVGAIRLSFGPCTTEAEITRGCRIIRDSAVALQSSCLLKAPGGFQAPETLRDGILQFRVGASNSWVIAHRESRTCIIIDPCDTIADRFEQFVRCQNLRILSILDTHSHADHDSIRPILNQILGDQLATDPATVKTDALGWPIERPNTLMRITLDDGTESEAIKIADTPDGGVKVLARIHTPGHTSDSHAFLYGTAKAGKLLKENVQIVFPGDTILGGGLGRTNFSTSDASALFHSLKKLHSVVSPFSLICPAHDYNNSFATNLSVEESENPILALATNPSDPAGLSITPFLQKKQEVDSELERIEVSFQGMVCGVAKTSVDNKEAPITMSHQKLAEEFKSAAITPLIIDVREPQEFSLFKNWSAMGLEKAPRNVPLSRFVNFISELATDPAPGKIVVLICWSGTRSTQAAHALRRLKLANAYSLEGGLALSGAQ